MQEQIFISIPMENFKDVIRTTILEVINTQNKNIDTNSDEPPLTRKQVADYLHISLTTLDKYTRLEIIKGHKMGKRVLYKKSEINSSLLEKNQFSKHQSL